jgi:hypothetical protein
VSVKSIIAELPKLSPAELEIVATWVAANKNLPGKSRATKARTVGDDDWLLAGIASELSDRGLLPKEGGYGKLLRLPSYPVYKNTSPQVLDQLEPFLRLREKPWPRPRLFALGKLFAYLLARYISYYPVEPDRMLKNIGRLIVALEASFPGYLASGLIPILLERERVNTNPNS